MTDRMGIHTIAILTFAALTLMVVTIPIPSEAGGEWELKRAARRGNPLVITELVIKGADVNWADEAGMTALHWSVIRGKPEAVKALLAAGADVNAKTIWGATALHLATMRGTVELVEVLLNAGADVNAKDKRGTTALKYAFTHGRRDLAKVIKSHSEPDSHSRPRANLANCKSLAGKAINVFGLDMYAKLNRGDKNLIYSPLSVFTPLAISYAGAKGRTRDEMAKVLGVKRPKAPLHVTLGGLLRELSGSIEKDGGELALANGLWVHKFQDYRIRNEFSETVRNNYDAMIRQADFVNSPQKVADEINTWVGEKTAGRIPGLVSPGQIARQAWELAIVNAVYFKGIWLYPFKTRNKSDESFTLLDSSEISVPMMHKRSRLFMYMEEPAFQALELPYEGDDLSMVVFLPRKVDGLAEFEESLSPENLASWLGKLSHWLYGLIVHFPRFEMRSRFDMNPQLRSMGMRAAFGTSADFSGMLEKKRPDVPNTRLFIAAVVHEAWIQVNEKGTEAAASTIVAHRSSKRRNEPKVFRADHPFMFIIWHKPTNCILFMGRVTDPRAATK